MTRFSLPPTQTEHKAAFTNSRNAATWLAAQPQANAGAMLGALVAELQTFNTYRVEARERFKTLEVLRKVVFAVSGECQRRYENKPLPLPSAEQLLLDKVRQLWRACAVGYLHCLQACVEADPLIASHSATVVHRALSALRMAQMNSYFGGAEIESGLWQSLHSAFAVAEELGVANESIEDRLFGETRESSPAGQYGMALLLHLARPFSLSRAQFAAVTRWIVRWREQVKVLAEPDQNPKSRCLALDIAQDKPFHDHLRAAVEARWFSVGSVLRKIRQRVDLLATGETPENLKLGSGLTSDACVELLNTFFENIKNPQHEGHSATNDAPSVIVATGLENGFRFLGGKGLRSAATATSSFGNQLSQEQIAVFGHVVNDDDHQGGKIENWILVREDPSVLQLVRPAGGGESRLALRGLMAIKLRPEGRVVLALITSLHSRADGSLCVSVGLLPGQPAAILAEVREKPSGKLSNHPALMLRAEKAGAQSSMLLAIGVPSRALSIRFNGVEEGLSLGVRLGELAERGSDFERWALADEVSP